MNKLITLLINLSILTLSFSSCNWAEENTKKAANKTGEIIGKTGTEFGVGVINGVKMTFENEVKISDNVKSKGLEIGEVLINSTDSTTDNVLTMYIIFNEYFNEEITIKIFAENGKENGRLRETLNGKEGDAKHFDFYFDKHVNIRVKGNITIE